MDVIVRKRDFAALVECLAEAGFTHRRTHLAKYTFKGREAGEVDVYTERVGEVPVEEAMFRRARALPYGGIVLTVASLEDLLHLKLAAGRDMDLADAAVLLHEQRDDVDPRRAETLVGLDVLRRSAPRIPDLLPEEYGWQARQRLKAWLRDQGWFPPRRGPRPKR